MVQDDPKITVQIGSTKRAVEWLVREEDTSLHQLWQASDMDAIFRMVSEAEVTAREEYFVRSSVWLAVAESVLTRPDMASDAGYYLRDKVGKVGARRKAVASLGHVAGNSALEERIRKLLDKVGGLLKHPVIQLTSVVLVAAAVLAVMVVLRK